jgi:outer membrane biosynthesis protein TonB
MTRTVWAFAELEELNGEMGFVAVADDLADELLKAGQVQDPYLTEPLKLIGTDPGRRSGRYATRQIKAGEPENGSDDARASATKPQQTPKPEPAPAPKPAEPKPDQPEEMPKPAPPKPDQAPAESRARRGRPPSRDK